MSKLICKVEKYGDVKMMLRKTGNKRNERKYRNTCNRKTLKISVWTEKPMVVIEFE